MMAFSVKFFFCIIFVLVHIQNHNHPFATFSPFKKKKSFLKCILGGKKKICGRRISEKAFIKCLAGSSVEKLIVH